MHYLAVAPKGRRRWAIGVLLGASVVVNYFDRLALSVVGPQLQTDLHFDTFKLGVLFGAFSLSYAACQIPSGVLLDKLGVAWVGRIGISLWAIASGLTALVSSFAGIMAARLVLSVAEAPSFPLNSKAVGYWFPRSERSSATSMFDGVGKLSQVMGVPVVAVILVHFGWRGAFLAMSLFSFAFLIVFWTFYRDPSHDKRLTREEYDYIVAGGAVPEGRPSRGPVAILSYVLSRRKVWGLTLGFGCFGYVNSMFFYWLPTYFVQTQNVGILKSASFTVVPWVIGATVQYIIGGWLVDTLIKRGHDETLVRKSVIVSSFVLALALIGVTFTTDIFWILFWMTISVSAIATASTVGWSLPSLVAPKGGTATVSSVMNTSNSCMSSISAVLTGAIVQATGSFNSAFLVAGCVLLAGIGFYSLMLGRIEPVPDMPESAAI
jgi:MFS transporter, ACS family, D-galactonate transporter